MLQEDKTSAGWSTKISPCLPSECPTSSSNGIMGLPNPCPNRFTQKFWLISLKFIRLTCLQWGMICPAETPEGQACGLVKNLALMAYISVGCASAPVLEFLEEWTMELLEEISPSVILQATKIFVNGAWVGVHRDPQMLVRTLRQMRRQVMTFSSAYPPPPPLSHTQPNISPFETYVHICVMYAKASTKRLKMLRHPI